MKKDLCKSLLFVLAMILVRVGSAEMSWYGFIDRFVQAIGATMCVYFAIRTETTNKGQ